MLHDCPDDSAWLSLADRHGVVLRIERHEIERLDPAERSSGLILLERRFAFAVSLSVIVRFSNHKIAGTRFDGWINNNSVIFMELGFHGLAMNV